VPKSIVQLPVPLRLRAALLAAAVCSALPATAQMRSPKEIEEAMRETQRAMDRLTPEQRKMLEQTQRQMSEQAAPGADDAEIGVPARDAARLAKVSRQPLTGAQLKAHVAALQAKLRRALAPEALRRAEFVEDVQRKAGGDLIARLRAAANGLAAWGAWPEATFLMGKVALASGNAQDLNNLAAFLTMQKASQAAAPILITLDARYPGNSTILNNLGQAWFELGEVKEAERVLLLAVRRSPNHPQANVTKSRIEEARGDKAAAQASMRAAIRGGFSQAKQRRLERLGGRLQKDDVRWTLPMPADPLGLGKLAPPPYPTIMDDLPTAIATWRSFVAQTATLGAELNQAFAARQVQRASGTTRGETGVHMPGVGQLAETPAASEAGRVHSVPGALAAKATAVYAFDKDALERKLVQLTTEVQQLHGGLQSDWMETGRRIATVRARCGAQPNFGGKGCGCGEIRTIVDNYLQRWNGQLRPLQDEWLAWTRRKADADAYFAQYTSPSEPLFEDAKRLATARYISTLANAKAAGVLGAEVDYCKPEQKPSRAGGKLADFDDLHCQHIVDFTVPGIGSISVRCNRMETRLKPFASSLEAAWTTDLNKDRVLSASAEVEFDGVTVSAGGEFDDKGLKTGSVGVEVGVDIGKHGAGPLEVGLGVKGGVAVEFDRSGVTDVQLKGSVGAKASSTIRDTEASKTQDGHRSGAKDEIYAGRPGASAAAEVKGTWSWNAGPSASASKAFDGTFF
jgi:tetratricopeptide (TPR) repeat protein